MNRLVLRILNALLGFLGALSAAVGFVVTVIWALDRSSGSIDVSMLLGAAALLAIAALTWRMRRVLGDRLARTPVTEGTPSPR